MTKEVVHFPLIWNAIFSLALTTEHFLFLRDITMKVDWLITKEVVCFPLGLDRPMRYRNALHIVVFDESVSLCFYYALHLFLRVSINPFPY